MIASPAGQEKRPDILEELAGKWSEHPWVSENIHHYTIHSVLRTIVCMYISSFYVLNRVSIGLFGDHFVVVLLVLFNIVLNDLPVFSCDAECRTSEGQC